MAYQSPNPFPEECANGINRVAAYQMYISDVYLTLAYSFTEPKVMPAFAVFLEHMSAVKWEQAKEFLRFLRRRNCINSVPFIQRANIGPLETPEKALPDVVNLEEELTRIMEDLKTSASRARETRLVKFTKDLLVKQNKHRRFLEQEILDYRRLEEYRQQRRLSENPAGASVSGEDTTSGGSTANLSAV
ncbi:ferritin light chain, oocyte isoform-like [Heterocephalus glaber]|uniref:Ferritin n=1 Tax=Heterocephalus glaber TaxID=10181 RepID=A0AAX6PRX5_HETGA|nr:ferritin light chain, oocyte isoform-like [Heterocephalus glaber]